MPHCHLSLEERRRLARFRESRIPVTEIAAALGRHRSTIYRELKRNWWRDAEVPRADGYWPVSAQALAARRRHALGKLARRSDLRAAVVERLENGGSPEQIAGRLRLEQDGRNRLCHETIYRFVYSKEGQSQELARHLHEQRRVRRPRRARKPRLSRGFAYPSPTKDRE